MPETAQFGTTNSQCLLTEFWMCLSQLWSI